MPGTANWSELSLITNATQVLGVDPATQEWRRVNLGAMLGGRVQSVGRTADSAARTNNTHVDDGVIQADLEAGHVYLMLAIHVYESGAAAGFRRRWARTGLSDADLYVFSHATGQPAGPDGWDGNLNSGGGGAGVARAFADFGVVVARANGGTIRLQWGQQVTTPAENAILRAGSSLFIKEMT